METFFFKLEIRPTLTSPEYAQVSGGSVLVFVLDDDAKSAAQRAYDCIKNASWEIVESSEAGKVEEENLVTDDQKELFSQTQRLGICYAYCLYRLGAPKFN
jgi:hypothetical protein